MTLDKLIPLVNRLGVTVDFLFADYIVAIEDDTSLDRLNQLLHGKTSAEKELAVNMVKLLFSYTNGKFNLVLYHNQYETKKSAPNRHSFYADDRT